MMDEFHLVASVSGSCYCACLLTVTLSWFKVSLHCVISGCLRQKLTVVIETAGLRSHRETRPPTADLELWRDRDSSIQNTECQKFSQCDCCYDACLQPNLYELTQNTLADISKALFLNLKFQG